MSTQKNIHDFIGKGRLLAWAAAGALLITPVVAFGGDGEAADGEQSRGERVWSRLAERFDQNGDAQITAEEVGDERRFARMDKNGDQVVTAADFEGFEGRARHRHRGPGPRHLLAAADVDQDHKVTQEEFQAFVAGIDADSDGVITEEEMTAHREAHHKALGIERPERPARPGHGKGFFDQDGDGQVKTEELSAIFTKMDRNGDGLLSEDDRPERRARGKRGDRPGRGPRLGARLMKQADVNGDKQLTREEWTGYLATVDSNTDGLLSREELEAIRPADAPEPPARPEGLERPAPEVSHLTAIFDRLDADSNGVIEGEEWPRRGRRGHHGPRGGRFHQPVEGGESDS